MLVISLVALIGLGVLGLDNGVLASMARHEYARGLITFLFAVVTIGTALVLAVSALIGSGEVSEKQFQHGKEVLSLLLGVFGTIIGYYFGATRSAEPAPSLRVSSLEVVPNAAPPGSTVAARALIAGGVPPYHYSIVLADEKLDGTVNPSENGLIAEQVSVPNLPSAKQVLMQLTVTDARGTGARVSASIRISLK